MKTAKDYQKDLYLEDWELDDFQKFLDDPNQTNYKTFHKQKITKMENGILSRVGMVPPHKWDEFDKELNKTFGTNPVIDFIKK